MTALEKNSLRGEHILLALFTNTSEHPAVGWGWIIRKLQQRTTTRLLGAHCRHSLSEVARQCEADMSGKSVPNREETGKLETRRHRLPRLYIYSLKSIQLTGRRAPYREAWPLTGRLGLSQWGWASQLANLQNLRFCDKTVEGFTLSASQNWNTVPEFHRFLIPWLWPIWLS